MGNASFWAGLLLGGALVGAAWWLGPRTESVPTPSGNHAEDHGMKRGPGRGERAQQEVVRRLEAIEAALARLGTRGVPGAADTPGDGPRLSGAGDEGLPLPADTTLTEEAVAAGMERLAERRLERMSANELFAESERLLHREASPVRAKPLLEALIARDLDPDDRARALTSLGVVHRGLEDYDEAADHLEEALHIAGEDSDRGVSAMFQLVWTWSAGKEDAKAKDMAERLLRSPRTNPNTRASTRWVLARIAQRGGDVEGARAAYRAMLEDYGDEERYAKIVREVRTQLAALDG